MRKAILLLLLSAVTALQAQIDVRTLQLSQTHPRYLTNADGKQVTRDLIENEPWAKEVFDKLKSKGGFLYLPDRGAAGLAFVASCHVLEFPCHRCIYKR